MLTLSDRQLKIFSFFLLTAYVLLRFVFIHVVDSFGRYASYIVEVFFILIAMVLFSRQSRLKLTWSKIGFFGVAFALMFGWLVYETAVSLSFVIPFDLRDRETLLFLLFLGPVIEEFIFRYMMWNAIHQIIKNPLVTVALTASVFAYAHFAAYFLVPEELKSFVVFQTIYTLLIGIWWGFVFQRTRNIWMCVLLHIAFNFGFWLGFFL